MLYNDLQVIPCLTHRNATVIISESVVLRALCKNNQA